MSRVTYFLHYATHNTSNISTDCYDHGHIHKEIRGSDRQKFSHEGSGVHVAVEERHTVFIKRLVFVLYGGVRITDI